MPGLLDELISRIDSSSEEERKELEEMVAITDDMPWIPQPGPQMEAYLCEADELFYGGSAGSGKSDLLLGTASTAHINSLILRRVGADTVDFLDRLGEILDSTDGRNLSSKEWKFDGRKIKFSGCENEKDKERYKGRPHDLKGFDEIGDFTESQFRFIKTWNRSSVPGQRSRVICTGNPPTTAEGLWVIEYWAPWLDPRHPNPAKSGELRWFISDANGRDKEVEGPGRYQLYDDNGNKVLKKDGTPDKVLAKSRTFIRATLSDNKYYGDDYAATLDALPAELRAAYRDGRFDLSLKDNLNQVIPTSWIMAAIERRKLRPKPPRNIPMCAIGVDPTGGGDDQYTLAPRYDGWYADIVAIDAKKVPLGSDMAAELIKIRKNEALPILDVGGGYASGIILVLTENNIKFASHDGSKASTGRDKSKKLKMSNKRSEVHWRFREALDPDQPGGSDIELPDDPMMISDLTAPTFKVTTKGIVVEPKKDIKKRIGRSPDRGDSVVNCWSGGLKGIEVAGGWSEYDHIGSNRRPTVKMGHMKQRRKR